MKFFTGMIFGAFCLGAGMLLAEHCMRKRKEYDCCECCCGCFMDDWDECGDECKGCSECGSGESCDSDDCAEDF